MTLLLFSFMPSWVREEDDDDGNGCSASRGAAVVLATVEAVGRDEGVLTGKDVSEDRELRS